MLELNVRVLTDNEGSAFIVAILQCHVTRFGSAVHLDGVVEHVELTAFHALGFVRYNIIIPINILTVVIPQEIVAYTDPVSDRFFIDIIYNILTTPTSFIIRAPPFEVIVIFLFTIIILSIGAKRYFRTFINRNDLTLLPVVITIKFIIISSKGEIARLILTNNEQTLRLSAVIVLDSGRNDNLLVGIINVKAVIVYLHILSNRLNI